MKGPLFRDPIYDGAADPVLIWNRQTHEWWMIYTNRRATAEGPKFAWVHGTDLGVASSADGGKNWVYRGTLTGLEIEWGRNTFWAPEIVWHEGLYHMYISYIRGVPDDWPGHKRETLHYTSPDLIKWTFVSRLSLSSDRVIDACVHRLPDGRFRMWYKDEAHGSSTWAADSDDLYHWRVRGPVITERPHEGPNVFRFKGWYWMVVDEWRGQGVYRSSDLETWERNGLILDKPGVREDDGTVGLHADVVVQGDEAYIFYFTHPDRREGWEKQPQCYAFRRSSIQVARLDVKDGKLVCDRNEHFELKLRPEERGTDGLDPFLSKFRRTAIAAQRAGRVTASGVGDDRPHFIGVFQAGQEIRQALVQKVEKGLRQKRMNELQTCRDHFIRRFVYCLKSPGPPVQTFHLIGQDNALNGQTVRQRHFKRVAFPLAGNRTDDRKTGDFVKGLRRQHDTGACPRLFIPGLRTETDKHQIPAFGCGHYKDSFPSVPKSISACRFSGVTLASSSSSVGFFFLGTNINLSFSTLISNSDP